MKIKLVFLLLLLSKSLYSQLFPVNETTIDTRLFHANFKEEVVRAFAISNQITIREFNEYLRAVRRDSSEKFYATQLPKSRTFPAELLQLILTDSALQNQPMPGVSWTVARNYCNWMNHQTSSKIQGYTYDLPYLSELIAFHILYGTSCINELEDWTSNSYDESMLEFSNSFNYSYSAKDSDPPAMKRKIIFGGSYHMDYQSSAYRKLQYEYQDSSSRYVGFRIVKRFNSEVMHSITINDLHVKYSTKNNQLNGIYQENFPNGELKVLGTFSNGNRIGVWSVWDENGNLKIQRTYLNNKSCTFNLPIVHNPYHSIYGRFPEYSLERNKDGIYPYSYIEERAVVYSHRTWRELTAMNEPNLFSQIDFNAVADTLFKNDCKWFYYGKQGDFKTVVSTDSLPVLRSQFGEWDFSRIAVKEDFYFNMDNLLSDTRQVGLSFYKNTSDLQPSFMLYYPGIRKSLASFNIANPPLPEIENLDDLFFFHAYRGKIDIGDKGHMDSPSDDFSTDEFSIELKKYVDEHEHWLMYGR